MPDANFIVRTASTADVGIIARHRAEMFRDIHGLDDAACAVLLDASRTALDPLLASGDYRGWLASPVDNPHHIVGGAGIRLRAALPSVQKHEGRTTVTVGREGLIVNVFTEHAWRRRGLAALLMRRLMSDVHQLDLASMATNEMRYAGAPRTDSDSEN